MTTDNTPKSAKDMTDDEYRAARAKIAAGTFNATGLPDGPMPDARTMTEVEFREFRRRMHVDRTRWR